MYITRDLQFDKHYSANTDPDRSNFNVCWQFKADISACWRLTLSLLLPLMMIMMMMMMIWGEMVWCLVQYRVCNVLVPVAQAGTVAEWERRQRVRTTLHM